MPDDLYAVLDVAPTASAAEIKAAYRRLSLLYHPDRTNGQGTARFQEISSAYKTLSEGRAQYDAERAGTGSSVQDVEAMMRAFMEAFGSGAPKPKTKPEVIHLHVCVPLSSVFDPSSASLAITRRTESGATETENVYVDIHQGADTGEVITLPRMGHEGRGDVKVTVAVENDTIFKRVGLDLFYTKELTLKEALCGVDFEINHVREATIRISKSRAIIAPNTEVVVRNGGVPRGSVTGRLVIVFHVVFPTHVSEALRTCLEQEE
jgi:DnaJ-class molecular chaperone